MWEASEIPLAGCAAGDEADVLAIEAESGVAARLRELGIVPGARLRVRQAGSPMILEIDASRFCLRADELDGVLVQIARTTANNPVATSKEAREPV